MTTYSRDSEGKFIPATQRLDGTWRKARRVKDGYVPQDEVPLYESKGKLFMKKPDLPVGMCPMMAQQMKEKRDKQQQQQKRNKSNPVPGVIVLPKNNANMKTGKPSTQKEKVPTPKDIREPKELAPNTQCSVNEITESVADIELSEDHDLGKKLKKLKKKIREIEALEAKIKSGEVKKPGKDQLDKIKRKQQILNEINEIEQQNN